MRRTLLADLAARDQARLTQRFVTPDADGEPQFNTLVGGLADKRARASAFKANPVCVQCEEVITKVEDCGMIQLAPGNRRVAHRKSCFKLAVIALNPTFSSAAVLRRDAVEA